MKVQECRMYENEFPKENDIVMCKVSEIFDDGAYVELLEYNNIRGMILKTEMSKNRIQSVKQIVREGKEEVLIAIRIDPIQGFIDLSKKEVKTDENKEFQEFYGKSKQVHTIMKSIAIKLGISKLEDLYKKFGWPMYKDYKHAYDAFKEILNNPNAVLDKYNLSEEMKRAVIDVVKVKLVPHPSKIKAEVKVTCFTQRGVDDIRDTLREGINCSTNDIKVKIHMIASPLYEIFTETTQKTEGLAVINEVIKTIEKSIKDKGGNFVLESKPEVMGENVAKDLEEQLKEIKDNENEDDEIDEDHDEGIKANIEGFEDDEMNNNKN